MYFLSYMFGRKRGKKVKNNYNLYLLIIIIINEIEKLFPFSFLLDLERKYFLWAPPIFFSPIFFSILFSLLPNYSLIYFSPLFSQKLSFLPFFYSNKQRVRVKIAFYMYNFFFSLSLFIKYKKLT